MMQSSLAFMVSFRSPASSIAQEDISKTGDTAIGFRFGIFATLINVCGCMAGTDVSIVVPFVAKGVNMMHDARNKAPSKYLMVFSLSPICQ